MVILEYCKNNNQDIKDYIIENLINNNKTDYFKNKEKVEVFIMNFCNFLKNNTKYISKKKQKNKKNIKRKKNLKIKKKTKKK